MTTGKSGGRKALSQTASSPRRRVSATTGRQIITLLTDFGTADHFVAAMKGVILSINPGILIVDITHEIPPQDVHAAAFTILAAHESFPQGTIHVAVVDPGVGSTRLPILIEAAGQIFVGPDNGIFSYVSKGREIVVHSITNECLFRQSVSSTFHGRDVFAPVAAAIANGARLSSLGPEIQDCVRLPSLTPARMKDGRLEGRIIHIDRFGNCITNFTRDDLTEAHQSKLSVNKRTIKSFRDFYVDESDGASPVFAYWGSAGFLEFAKKNGSAAKVLNVKVGDKVSAKR